ncbi:MAG: hypothetical protein KDA89_00035, partial [Planctomycetaceae bacterium]|nr:hypothetical protein [Planctomycetaceae bacterium]
MHWRRFLRRHLGKWCLKCVLPAVLLTALPEDVLAQRFSREIAGAVRMHNGYVLRGLCDTSNTLDPLLLNQRLELRRINQSFRTYFVHVRNSDAVVPDASAVPTENFDIFQRRTGSRPMDYAIGAHRPPQFDAEGRGQMTLNLGGGRTVDLDVAITALNSVSATVS